VLEKTPESMLENVRSIADVVAMSLTSFPAANDQEEGDVFYLRTKLAEAANRCTLMLIRRAAAASSKNLGNTEGGAALEGG